MSRRLQSGMLLAAAVGIAILARDNVAAKPRTPTCNEVETRVGEAAGAFRETLVVPIFVDDPDWKGGRTTRSISSVTVVLGCEGGQFQTYEAFILEGDTAELVRWTLWSQASLMATDHRLDKTKAFRLIDRLQKAAIVESAREEIRSGDRSGCARLKSGAFEFEYSVRPGQARVAFRPAEDEMESCRLLR